MKYTALIALCFWGWIPLIAQSLQPDVIGTSGGSGQNPTVQLEWQVGEVIIGTIQNGQQQLDQGFFLSDCAVQGVGMITGDCYFACAGDTTPTYQFAVSGFVNAEQYFWTITPNNAATIISGQWTDTIEIKFTDSLTNYLYFNVTPSNSCNIGVDAVSDTIELDTACVWPGDINNDGIVTNTHSVNWVRDVLSLDKAWVEYFYGIPATYLDPSYPYNFTIHQRNLPCINADITNLYSWKPYPMFDWLRPNGAPFLYNDVDHSIRNLKYADADSDGKIERGFSDYYRLTGKLNHSTTDTDVLFHNLNKTHNGNNPTFQPPKENPKSLGDLRIVHYQDSISPNGDNLVLSIFAGDSSNVIPMRSIALKVYFDIGIYERPYVEYAHSHFGDSLTTRHADYIHIDSTGKGETYAYITISKDDLQNTYFTDNLVCNLICDVPVAWVGGGTTAAKNGGNPQQSVTVSIVEAASLDSVGNFRPLTVSSITANVCPKITINTTVTPETCAGNDGSIVISPLNGTAPYTITCAGITNTDTMRTGLIGGTYTVIIADSNSCADTTLVLVESTMPPTTVFTQSTTTPILNTPTTYSVAIHSANQYHWSVNNGVITTGQNTPQVTIHWTTTGIDTVTIIKTDTVTSCADTTKLGVTISSNNPFVWTPTNQSGVFLGQAQVGGIAATTNDWIAAYDANGNCAGATAIIVNNGIAYITLPIYGDDPTTIGIDEGINSGEYFTLKLYDASAGIYRDYPSPVSKYQFTQWWNTNGAPMPAYNNSNAIYNFLETITDTIILKTGWNLISTDVIPSDSSLTSVFADLETANNLVYVTGFDNGATFYDPDGLPFLNTLTHFTRGFGYWVKVNIADTLIITGLPILSSFKSNLNSNWNLTAYVPQATATPVNYFVNLIATNNLIYVTGFDNGAAFYDPNGLSFLNTLSSLTNGFGYWVKVNNAVGGNAYRPISGIRPTNVYNFLNGTSNLAAFEGEEITVELLDGTVVGYLTILGSGDLMTTSIYGDDPTTLAADGVFIGEKLQFRFRDVVLDANIYFSGNMELIPLDLQFDLMTTNEVHQLEQIKIYPNPTNDLLTIDYQNQTDKIESLRLYNTQGQLVKQLSVDSEGITTANINNLPSGVYILSINDRYNQRVVKID